MLVVEQWEKWKILLILRKLKFSCFVSYPNQWGERRGMFLKNHCLFLRFYNWPAWAHGQLSAWPSGFQSVLKLAFLYERVFWWWFCFKLFSDSSVMDWKEYVLGLRFWWNILYNKDSIGINFGQGVSPSEETLPSRKKYVIEISFPTLWKFTWISRLNFILLDLFRKIRSTKSR